MSSVGASSSSSPSNEEDATKPLWRYVIVTRLEKTNEGGGNVPWECKFCHQNKVWKNYNFSSEGIDFQVQVPSPKITNQVDLSLDTNAMHGLVCQENSFSPFDQFREGEEDPSQVKVEEKFKEEEVQDSEDVNLDAGDTSQYFVTDKIFDSRDDLMTWTRSVGKKHGAVLVTKKSHVSGRVPTLLIGCERGGKYRAHKSAKEVQESAKKASRKRKSRTIKCDCPFVLEGIYIAGNGKWKVQVQCGRHNHPLASYLEGRSYARRLTEEELSIVAHMTNSGVKPSQLMQVIKMKNPENASTLRHLYNERAKIKRKEIGERLQLQQLTMLLTDGGYMHWSRRNESTGVVNDLFFVHPESIQMLKCFPYVILIDCTYKANMYKWPLFEAMGITSTMMTFSICFGLFEEEKEDNYLWVLEQLRSLLDKDTIPGVIVTHGEGALLNAIKKVFPEAKQLLCRWQIARNVMTNSKNEFSTKETWDNFNDKWTKLTYSASEDEYNINLASFNAEFKDYPVALNYVKHTWLDSYKEMFVAAWTDQHFHFGATTISRVESAHAKLKRGLVTSRNDFLTLWKALKPMIDLQLIAIKTSFEKSLNLLGPKYKWNCFHALWGFISKEALDLLLEEKKRIHNIGLDINACNHLLLHTHGLPCAHQIVEYERQGRPIPLASIHQFWKKLSCIPIPKERPILYYHPEFQIFADCFEKADPDIQRYLLKRLKELATPSSSWLVEAAQKKTNPRGRPRGSKGKMTQVDSSTKIDPQHFEHVLESPHLVVTPQGTTGSLDLTLGTMLAPKKQKKASKVLKLSKAILSDMRDALPSQMLQYIEEIIDVKSDGHCGFRAVALALGKNIDSGWSEVRDELMLEMKSGKDVYSYLFGGQAEWDKVMTILDCHEAPCSPDKWMLMPETGHLIASRYEVSMILISEAQCLTFLPLMSPPNPTKPMPSIAVGYINKSHFVHLKLKPGCPIPPIADLWHRHRSPQAEGWFTSLVGRINLWEQTMPSDIATKETFDLDR